MSIDGQIANDIMIRFGPAGIPIGLEKGGTKEGVAYTAKIGLTAYEVEFVRGVKMKVEDAKIVRQIAKQNSVTLSAHCPYWINTVGITRDKIDTAKRNLLQTAEVASAMAARIIVFHPGYYMKRSSEECVKLSIKTLSDVREKMEQNGWSVILGLETGGLVADLGTLEECIDIANGVGGAAPVIDFAHIHGRNNGCLRKKEDFAKIFETIEKRFVDGKKYVKNFHSHFSELEYSSKGELRHIPLGEEDEPPFKPLAEVIVENDYGGTIICESPLLEEDALKMKRTYEKMKRRSR
jgi:deoxyribonuclease-4